MKAYGHAALRIALLLTIIVPSSCSAQEMGHSFEIGEKDFLLDGKPFLIRSGEMHAARIPPEYWKHRLQMVRAMGCNTVCAYLFWNMHEPKPGEFDFSGPADAAAYCRIAQEAGLKVILRPGPYSCAEWEFGGLPWWLLKNPDIRVRTRDPRYLDAVRNYIHEVGKQLAPLQISRGGPIIMVQVENEYGSYGDDREYIGAVRDDLKEAGFDVPFFTCDGASQLSRDTRPEIFSVVNFGDDPRGNFEALRKIRVQGPLMCGEYYPGWFDSWGKAHHTGTTENILNDLGYMLDNNASFSIYMVHGGTSFGYWAGANSPPFSPQSTSYDYDAPIDESGHATPKYYAIRELFKKHLQPGEVLPDVPEPIPSIKISPFGLDERAPLFENLGVARHFDSTVTMEQLDQASGCMVYRTKLAKGSSGILKISGLSDIGQIFLDGVRVGTIDRRYKKSISITIPPITGPGMLDIFVEAMGRINYGKDIHDRKGIAGSVQFSGEKGFRPSGGWDICSLPCDYLMISQLRFSSVSAAKAGTGPVFRRGSFTLQTTGDTHLDMRGWGRGSVWVNGHHLGRYWHIGPQQTLYVPGVWLKQGSNSIVALDLDPPGRYTTQGLAQPILNEVEHDEAAPPAPIRARGNIQLDSADVLCTGSFSDGPAANDFSFAQVTCRYAALQSLSSQRGDPFASAAEIYFIGDDGKALPREGWKIFYVDGEELEGEDGRAENAFDDDAETIWHSQWYTSKPPHPHVIAIDLGAPVKIRGVRYLPRPTDSPGRIKEFRVYGRSTGFTITR